MTKSVEVIVEDEGWKEIDGYSDWNKSLDVLFQETKKKKYQGNKRCWIGLLLTDDARIKILNRNFLKFYYYRFYLPFLQKYFLFFY